MRKFRLMALLLALVFVVTGCGGGSGHGATRPAQTLQAGPQQHVCQSADFIMQCALANQPAPSLRVPHASLSTTIAGGDFAWGSVSASTARSLGWRFAASYLSGTSKDWTPSSLAAYHALGIATVAVRETSADRALQGCAAGRADALSSVAELNADGAPKGTPFTMAIDFDASGPDVAPYFACAHQAVGDRENAYGGYRPLGYLCSRHLVGHLNWATYAWSGGLWPPASCAPLEQWLNGSTWDHDRAIAAYYGQWPYAVPPPPGPTAAQLKQWTGARDSSLRAYHAQRCKLPVFSTSSCYRFANRVVYFQAKVGHVSCFGAHAAKGAPVCQIVAPRAAARQRAAGSTRRAMGRLGCVDPAQYWPKGCESLDKRYGRFARLAHADRKAWA